MQSVFKSIKVSNALVSVSLCYRRTGPHRPRWDRTGDRVETSSTECLNNTSVGAGSGPTTPHLVPSFSTPGRTSSIHRQSAVPLSSFPKSVHDCGAVSVKYRTYSSGGSYVGIPPPGEAGEMAGVGAMPLVADIPAPGQFSSKTMPRGGAGGKEDSITC